MRRLWLWIPLLIVGSCSAVAVPNLLTAMQRSHQKRSMADMRTVSSAIEAYMIDHPDWKPERRGYVTAHLASLLQPKYVKDLPRVDAWQHPIHVALWTDKDSNPQYRIWSLARDGKRDAAWGNPGYTTNFDNDIVFENGAFTQYPEGV